MHKSNSSFRFVLLLAYHLQLRYCNCNHFYSLDRVLPQDVLILLHLFSLLISVILMLVLEIWLKYLFLLLFFHLLLSLKFQKPLNDKKKMKMLMHFYANQVHLHNYSFTISCPNIFMQHIWIILNKKYTYL